MYASFLKGARAEAFFKGTKAIAQNNCWHKNLLGNEQWRVVEV